MTTSVDEIHGRLTAALPAVGRDVAAALGDGWTSAQQYSHSVFLVGPDGAKLMVTASRRQVGKYSVVGCAPDGGTYWRDTGINVSATRGASAIAREIARRLLPAYLVNLAEAQARLARRAEADANRAAVIDQIQAALPFLRKGETMSNQQGRTTLTVRVEHSGNVRVKVDGSVDDILPALLALRGVSASG